MRRQSDPNYAVREGVRDALDTVRRAFEEFLTLPTALIAAFVLLAIGTYWLDQIRPAALEPLRAFLAPRFFPDARSTANLLSAIATAMIGVTSITVTLLLLVLQQSASAMTMQVFDQFLRRRSNQLFFGFFVGLALLALIIETSVNEHFVPVFGATLVFLLTAVALYVLVLLLYTIINQTRPAEIVAAIHDHALAARARELDVIGNTRAQLDDVSGSQRDVLACRQGYVTRIGVKRLCDAVRAEARASVVLRVSIGTYVSFHDVVANVRAPDSTSLGALQEAVTAALVIERKRDIAWDAIYGVEELQSIGWTAISSAKSNPATGITVIRTTRDLLARWASDGPPVRNADAPWVVYRDPTIDRLFDAFETFAVASNESRQHQSFAEVVETFALLFPRLPHAWQPRAEDAVRRILACVENQLPTAQIDDALRHLAATLVHCHHRYMVREVERARERLAEAFGHPASPVAR